MGHGIREHDTMMSVRQKPWHGLGVVLDDYPDSIDEALERAGLIWKVKQGDVYVAAAPEPGTPNYIPALEANMIRAQDFRANVREDTGEVLGIVSDDYKVVDNREAFAWLEALLGGEIEIETAGSLGNGRRVWVLAKIPENVEVGGDEVERYVYCANSHDGSMAVTAAATNIRVVCQNTLGWALRKSELSERTYRFRHTGDLALKLDEARKVMQITLNWNAAFKELGDQLARDPLSLDAYVNKVARPLIGFTEEDEALMIKEDRKIARRNREDSLDLLVGLFQGDGEHDTTGNAPGTKWTAVNATAEWADWYRRYTKRTDQMARSMEDQRLKDRGLELTLAA